MATKAKEATVDDLLNSLETGTSAKAKVDNKKPKPEANGWEEDEDQGFALGLGKDQQQSKTKTKKKQTGAAKGWGDQDPGANQPPKTTDFSKIQDDESKKKVIKKPGTQVKNTTNIDIGEASFPSLGEDRPKNVPKKNPEPTPVPQPVVETPATTGGVKKFMNVKKQGAGESFVPIEPIIEKVVVPVEKPVESSPPSQQKTTGGSGFIRRGEEPKKEEQPPVDSKFKFGGEGPRKFVASNKISFKREEEKNEQDIAREQREREIEEKLAKEREELAKQREARESKKKEKDTKEGGHGQDEKHKDEKQKDEKHVDGKEKTEKPQEEKKITRFSNPKKEVEKAHVEAVPEKVEVEVHEAKPGHAKESIEMHGALSNKGWGDGPIIKKGAKK